MCLASLANFSLWLCVLSPLGSRPFTMSPLESSIQIRFLASSWVAPSLTIAMTRSSAMPKDASPAPMKRILLEARLVLVIFMLANNPATATDAVP
uniref:Putative secreted protein n=1 Tax=Ixodes ricinus TaxID=34613 RepID=A0A6B0UD09_IXORI